MGATSSVQCFSFSSSREKNAEIAATSQCRTEQTGRFAQATKSCRGRDHPGLANVKDGAQKPLGFVFQFSSYPRWKATDPQEHYGKVIRIAKARE